MKRILLLLVLCLALGTVGAQERRPIDNTHPLWLIHVDVWNKADPQKIIDLIPADIRPYVCINLSLSCQYDTEKNVYKMPQNAVKTYKSWGSVCQQNGMWFTCQPASGGHTHIQDDDMETFEYFFRHYPNFLGWNYAEQFWGFDEAGDKSSSTQMSRLELFSRLVPMAHKYGGMLIVSFCGNIWSHGLNPVGMMKRCPALADACRQTPEAILWLYKYTIASCFYNNESVTLSPFISGLAKNYGVRYDNCGYNDAITSVLGQGHHSTYPTAAGLGTVMEQTTVNGGAVWDGPELIWTEDFQNLSNSTVDGYTRRNWGTFPGFRNGWIDMFRKVIDGTLYIPTRSEVVGNTKIAVVNDISSGSDEQKYAAWGDLYDGLYKQDDPMNRGNGQWMDNECYFKASGRYGAIPVCLELTDSLAKSIPVQVKKSAYTSRWGTKAKKVADFNTQYAEASRGDLYVNRYRNRLTTYTPYSYFNSHRTASAAIPLRYNTCDSLLLTYGKLSSGLVREYADHIDFYLNNYRSDTLTAQTDRIALYGATAQPSYTLTKRDEATATATATYVDGVYVVEVSHMGPVDLTIQATGTATDRLTDTLPDEALGMPAQPAPYHGPITIEAEDMDYKNIKSCVTDPYGWYPDVRGHAGNGFMDMGTNTAGSLRHKLTLTEGGDYRITLRYTQATRMALTNIVVNGKRTTLKLDKTTTNEWKKATLNATLTEGENTLTVNNTGGVGIYIDNVTYTPADVEDETYAITLLDAEHGTVVASADEAAEGETVTLTVVPEAGYALKGWRVVHGAVSVSDDGTFTMPDDNVTLQPIFYDMTCVYLLDFTDVLAGNFPEGWSATQENDEVHAYPNQYASGARTMTGFTGYQGKALYWRTGKAEYTPLTLEAGDYTLTYAMAAWKGSPKYTATVLDANDNIIKTTIKQLALPNLNGNASGSVATAKEKVLVFTAPHTGDYKIRFTDATGAGMNEMLLVECRVNTVIPDAIAAPTTDVPAAAVYTLQGVRLAAPQRGVNIIRLKDGSAKKVIKR